MCQHVWIWWCDECWQFLSICILWLIVPCYLMWVFKWIKFLESLKSLNVLRRFRETGRVIQRPQGHRLAMTTPRKDCALIRIMRRNRFLSPSRFRVELIRRTGRLVSARMVQRRFVAAGYHPRRPARCPRLTYEHRRQRRVWAHGYRNWNHQHWSHVMIADESRLSLYHCDGHARVRRHVGERLVECCIQETNWNVGPSLMVSGAFHASGK